MGFQPSYLPCLGTTSEALLLIASRDSACVPNLARLLGTDCFIQVCCKRLVQLQLILAHGFEQVLLLLLVALQWCIGNNDMTDGPTLSGGCVYGRA